MSFPAFSYMQWAKSRPPGRINLARSGVEPCPVALLRATAADVRLDNPAGYGWAPLRAAIARRYRVEPDQVFPVSGGTSLANWVGCMTAADGGGRSVEVIVERPAYEALVRVPQALGCRVRRLERRFTEAWAVDLDRFDRLVTRRTRLAIVSNLHNPTGARIPDDTLAGMADRLRRVGGWLLVDEVYLECLAGARGLSAVHLGPNVIVTNSLTKAYGLDGLRAGWLLGPRGFIRRAGLAHDLLGVNGVSPGERLTLRALRNLAPIRRRSRTLLDAGLREVTRWLAGELRLRSLVPPGGNVVFPRLPRDVDADGLTEHLAVRASTLVVPGRFFGAPRHIRLSFGIRASRLRQGLRNVSRMLDALAQED